MAEKAEIRITTDIPGIEQVRAELLKFGTKYAAKYIASALRAAVKEGGTEQALKANTPRGPTGNLKRAIALKSVRYIKDGTGLAIVGYKSGRKINEPYDRTKLGYHQGLVEFGTKQRFRRTKDGRRVSTGKMPIGGSFGRPPLRTAWEQTRSRVEGLILKKMTEAIEAAGRELAYETSGARKPF